MVAHWGQQASVHPCFYCRHHHAQVLATLAQYQAKLHDFLWLGSPEPEVVTVGEHS